MTPEINQNLYPNYIVSNSYYRQNSANVLFSQLISGYEQTFIITVTLRTTSHKKNSPKSQNNPLFLPLISAIP